MQNAPYICKHHKYTPIFCINFPTAKSTFEVYNITTHTTQDKPTEFSCIIHLVKFINADHAPIGKHHGPSLESPLPCLLIGSHGSRQTNTRGATPSGGHSTGGSVEDVAEHLGLGRGWVTNQKNVDVTAHT